MKPEEMKELSKMERSLPTVISTYPKVFEALATISEELAEVKSLLKQSLRMAEKEKPPRREIFVNEYGGEELGDQVHETVSMADLFYDEEPPDLLPRTGIVRFALAAGLRKKSLSGNSNRKPAWRRGSPGSEALPKY